ncbi:hypothetical protein BRARA_E00894 [Brassica rapa]|uniref:Zinc finger PHD-type domain-containing protein n=2 Tax=Brassica campestris TaxID=3711 RepID=A0A397Z834_BRACM|nr:uncharacterized protein LOC125601590 [Brassica napus]RID61777.1 hypothetical protein BRARA_E00894 [Brassica rapa]
MDVAGEFHRIEKDGKLYFEYHHSKYHPIPQIQSLSSSNETIINNHTSQSLFVCPVTRCRVALNESPDRSTFSPIFSSPEYLFSTIDHDLYHSLLPLFWCNNKDFEIDGGCDICKGLNSGTDYYLCDYCNGKYHRECVQSPLKIKSPYHLQHSLQLCFYCPSARIIECLVCGRTISRLLYYCDICRVFMHSVCVMKPIPFVIDLPKRHDHPLTFFPRQTSLTCNVCGLLRKMYPTYICVTCNFVAHKDCMYFPRIIQISRHRHRISYKSSLPSGEWLCGVCRQNIEIDYGAYSCDKCCDYVVHSICALGKDVCDGEDLEGVPEEDDITLGVESFDVISEGVILHFLHDHHLYLQASILYDENKFCQACVLPIFEGNIYSCIECGFILHETCAQSRRKLQHALHPHPLTLRHVNPYEYVGFTCDACDRLCGGFIYGCHLKECDFDLDIRCASISEPVDYQGHEHPLYLALNSEEQPICHVCQIKCEKQLNCIICNFIICIKCTTLPYKVRYKYDKHFLRVLWEEEICDKSWCEVCEDDLRNTNTNVIYWCDECCITVHVECLFGDDPYLKHGQFLKENGIKLQILWKSNISRPSCNYCKNRCQHKMFMRDDIVACSKRCALSNS